MKIQTSIFPLASIFTLLVLALCSGEKVDTLECHNKILDKMPIFGVPDISQTLPRIPEGPNIPKIPDVPEGADPCTIYTSYVECVKQKARDAFVPPDEVRRLEEEVEIAKPEHCDIDLKHELSQRNLDILSGKIPVDTCATRFRADPSECKSIKDCVMDKLPKKVYYPNDIQEIEKNLQNNDHIGELSCGFDIKKHLQEQNIKVASPDFMAKEKCKKDVESQRTEVQTNRELVCPVLETFFSCILEASTEGEMNVTEIENDLKGRASAFGGFCEFNVRERVKQAVTQREETLASNPNMRAKLACRRTFSKKLKELQNSDHMCTELEQLLKCEVSASKKSELSNEESVRALQKDYDRAQGLYKVKCALTVSAAISSRIGSDASSVVFRGLSVVELLLALTVTSLLAI